MGLISHMPTSSIEGQIESILSIFDESTTISYSAQLPATVKSAITKKYQAATLIPALLDSESSILDHVNTTDIFILNNSQPIEENVRKNIHEQLKLHHYGTQLTFQTIDHYSVPKVSKLDDNSYVDMRIIFYDKFFLKYREYIKQTINTLIENVHLKLLSSFGDTYNSINNIVKLNTSLICHNNSSLNEEVYLNDLYNSIMLKITDEVNTLSKSETESRSNILRNLSELSLLFHFVSTKAGSKLAYFYHTLPWHTLWHIKHRIKRLITPKLGILNQYSPRQIDYHEKYHTPVAVKNPPKISVVTPSYQQGHFIEETIKSVIDQDYPNLEYVIQDGNSDDDTVAILEKYQSQLHHAESKPDKGQSNAINLGFQQTSGDIMCYLNSDDLLLPGSLHYIANYFNKHPKVDVVYGHRVLVDEESHEIGRWVLPPHNNEILSWADYIPQETMFWRRSIWEKAGGQIDESFKFAMDWDLILRFREAGARFKRLPRFLGAFRIHTAQKTSSQVDEIGLAEMNKLRERHLQKAIEPEDIAKHIRPYMRKHLLFHRLYRFKIFNY